MPISIVCKFMKKGLDRTEKLLYTLSGTRIKNIVPNYDGEIYR